MKIQNKSCLEMLTNETFGVIFKQCDVDVEACIKREKDPKFNQSSRAWHIPDILLDKESHQRSSVKSVSRIVDY